MVCCRQYWESQWENRSLVKDIDFTTDDIPRSLVSPYWLDIMDPSQRRSCDPGVSDCLRGNEVPAAIHSKQTDTSNESQSPPTTSENCLENLMSLMLKDIRTSVDVRRTSAAKINNVNKNLCSVNKDMCETNKHPTVPRSGGTCSFVDARKPERKSCPGTFNEKKKTQMRQKNLPEVLSVQSNPRRTGDPQEPPKHVKRLVLKPRHRSKISALSLIQNENHQEPSRSKRQTENRAPP